jgi:hypothetical protein
MLPQRFSGSSPLPRTETTRARIRHRRLFGAQARLRLLYRCNAPVVTAPAPMAIAAMAIAAAMVVAAVALALARLCRAVGT